MFNGISYDEQSYPKRVLLTGFGKFRNIDPNPSWEGVKAINKKEIERSCNIYLFREQVKVQYDYIDHCVPKLWDKYQPDLTIHVGVDSPDQSCFLIEMKAHKHNYVDVDDVYRHPANYQNSSAGPESIETELDVNTMCQEFNCYPPADGLRAEASCNAGRFLCEYIYYTSLCQNPSKSLFVHVPPSYTTFQIAKGLERIIEICLGQLQNN